MSGDAITRDALGRIAHNAYREWLAEQPDPDGWRPALSPAWDDISPGLREACMRIGKAVAAAERVRIRRGVLACEMVLQHPADGDRVAVLALDLEQVIGAEDGTDG